MTIWNDQGASLQLWRSVFERRAPQWVEKLESLLGMTLGTGRVTRDLRPEVLDALSAAYRDAVNGHAPASDG